MAKFNDKISTILSSQLPEFVIEQHPKFAEFLKVYYQLLESAELSVTSVKSTEGILLETETAQANNLVLNSSAIGTARTLLDAGDKIIFEIYFSKINFDDILFVLFSFSKILLYASETSCFSFLPKLNYLI